MSMVVIIAAAVMGIVAVCILNQGSKWNRLGGISAVILGCTLAILLYYSVTVLPDTPTLILTIGLTSFLLVLVSVLISLLCRGKNAGSKVGENVRTEGESTKNNRLEAPLCTGVVFELVPGIELELKIRPIPGADPYCKMALHEHWEVNSPDAGTAAGSKITERIGQDVQDREKTEYSVPITIPEPGPAAPQQEGIRNGERTLLENEQAPPCPEPVEKKDAEPACRKIQVSSAGETQEAMGKLRALVSGKEYAAALKQVLSIMNAGYALLPEEKKRLEIMLKMLKDKTV